MRYVNAHTPVLRMQQRPVSLVQAEQIILRYGGGRELYIACMPARPDFHLFPSAIKPSTLLERGNLCGVEIKLARLPWKVLNEVGPLIRRVGGGCVQLREVVLGEEDASGPHHGLLVDQGGRGVDGVQPRLLLLLLAVRFAVEAVRPLLAAGFCRGTI